MLGIDRRSVQNFDWMLLALTAALVAVGFVNLFSSTHAGAELSSEMRRQLLSLAVGVVVTITVGSSVGNSIGQQNHHRSSVRATARPPGVPPTGGLSRCSRRSASSPESSEAALRPSWPATRCSWRTSVRRRFRAGPRPRRGRIGPSAGNRPQSDASPAHCRCHRLRQECVHQRGHLLPAVQQHARRSEDVDGGPEDGGVDRLQ